MISRNGQRTWKNIHVTVKQTVEDLIDIDNSNARGLSLNKYETLNQASKDINDLIKEAKAKKKRIRAIGSAWALTNIQATEHWLINTKLLNGCFDADADCFHNNYPQDKRKLLVIAQCGISIAELNAYLEVPKKPNQIPRALKTAGIGAGQTVVGSVSGNTHGAAVNFGALPEFVVAIQVCTGNDKPTWIERSDYPVMNELFFSKVDSKLLRDSDIFNSAVVSFGAFGVITAYAIETEPIYHVKFPGKQKKKQGELDLILGNASHYLKLHHLEFVFDPHVDDAYYLIEGTKVKYEEGHPTPKPVWIITNKQGYAPGDLTTKILLQLPFLSAKKKSEIQFKKYLELSVLSDVRGTSGQLYTATITYLEGYNETAFAVSITNALKTIEIIKQLTRERKMPLVIQARVVHPGKTTFGFTNHSPKSVVFEFGIVNTSVYGKFEEALISKLREAKIGYTLHWSKNAGINKTRLEEMYGRLKINTWKKSRYALFQNDRELISIFNNEHLRQAELDGPPDS